MSVSRNAPEPRSRHPEEAPDLPHRPLLKTNIPRTIPARQKAMAAARTSAGHMAALGRKRRILLDSMDRRVPRRMARATQATRRISLSSPTTHRGHDAGGNGGLGSRYRKAIALPPRLCRNLGHCRNRIGYRFTGSHATSALQPLGNLTQPLGRHHRRTW